MSLSIQDAKGLIAEVKEREIALGRAPETWYTYENHVYGVANVARTIASKIKVRMKSKLMLMLCCMIFVKLKKNECKDFMEF